MTTRAEPDPRELSGFLTITLEVGTRVATAQVRAEAGMPVRIQVDDAAVLWREVARSPLRATVRRLAALAPVEVSGNGGRRLMRSYLRSGRSHTRWTAAGLGTLAAAGWIALTRH